MEAFVNSRHFHFLLVPLSLLLLALVGLPSRGLAGNGNQEELTDIERKLAAAVLKVDVATLERTYAEDFRFTHSTGDVQTKAEWLKALQSGQTSYTARNIDSIEVELHDDVAITTGRIHARTDSADARWQEYTVWYVRVYAQRDDRWQLLSHRTVREQTGPPPPSDGSVLQ